VVLLVAVFLDVTLAARKISSPQMLPRRIGRNRSNSNPTTPDFGGGASSTLSHSTTSSGAFLDEIKNLGTLLIELFEYYGHRFDPQCTGVAWSRARGGGVFFPLNYTSVGVVRPPLVLLDPFADAPSAPPAATSATTPNIAWNVFQFARVQTLFADAASALRADTHAAPTILSRIIHM